MTKYRTAVIVAAAAWFTGAAARAQNGHEGHVNYLEYAGPEMDPWSSAFSPSTQQWFQTHFSAMVSFSPYGDSRTWWWPRTYAYHDLYEIPIGSATAANHPEWVLKDPYGNWLYIPWGCQNGSCPLYAGDVANPAFRASVISDMQSMINRGNYAGFFVDDSNMEFRVSDGWENQVVPIDTNTGQLMSWDAWRNYIATFEEEIRAAFPSKTLIDNVIWYASGGSGVPGQDPYIQRQFKTADVINIEHGVANNGGLTGGTGFWSLYNMLNFIDTVHAAGCGINFEHYGLDPAGQEYALATWFLISNGSDSLGDNTVTPDNWFAGYSLDLGSALEPRTYANGIFQRNFTGGMVLVAEPGLAGQTINLPHAIQRLDGSWVNSVSLQGSQGAVLLGTSGGVAAAPLVNQSFVANAASPVPGPSDAMIAPGEIVSIFGQNFADDTQSASPPFPTSLSNTTVTIAGLNAPLLFASAGQINAMVPFEAPLGTVPVTVTHKGTSVANLSVTIRTVAPGIFTLGNGQGAILTSTGEIAGPGAIIDGLPARPARRGEYISIYLTGLGDVTNRPTGGEPTPDGGPYSETILTPTVTIGGAGASPTFSGLAPSFTGLYQVNVQVPDAAATGDAVQVTLQIGAATSNTVTTAVQ